MEKKPVTAIIVGAGHRALVYSELAKTNPEDLKIVGVADPNPVRRKHCMEYFGFGEDMCFESAQKLAEKGKLADTVINGTMDEQHIETAIPLLNAGYDMLLEKPFAVNEKEMRELVECAKKNNSKVMICHVLRYTPFYYSIKERIANGEIGDIINIQTTEHVSYHHLSTSYVRGKWANSEKCHTTMLLAKCCHDIDLMMWFMSETKPVKISSFGSPNSDTTNLHRSNKGIGGLCVTSCNTSPAFQEKKTVFYQMAQLVELFVVFTLFLAVLFWRDYGLHTCRNCIGQDVICVITPIRQQNFCGNTLNQVDSFFTICSGTFCNKDSDRHTIHIHGQMYFGVEPPFVLDMSWLPPFAPAP